MHIHIPYMHTYTLLTYIYIHTCTQRNGKHHLENGMSSKGRQKVKHYNQYYLNHKKLLTADLMLTK